MLDGTALVSAAGGIKTAFDLAKGLQALNTSTEVRQKTSELLDAVVDARFKLMEAADTQAALLERIKDLEQKVAEFENWDREKERYELQSIDRGAFAYVHKAGMEGSEHPIWLCQTCFDQRHKSALQYRGQSKSVGHTGGHGMQAAWGCNRCQAMVNVYYQLSPENPREQGS